MKRKVPDTDDDHVSTPRKLRTRAETEDKSETDDAVEAVTPSKRKRLGSPQFDTPRKSALKGAVANIINGQTTPKSQRRVLFTTPSKLRQQTTEESPDIVRNADRSARRKSNKKLIDRTIHGDDSDEEALDEEDSLAQQILSDEEDEAAEQGVEPEETPVPETPSKRKRGRPKGSGKKKVEKPPSPVPPELLPPHEKYFWQNRLGGNKTSNNTLSAEVLLNHDEYFETMQSYQDHHEPEREFLLELHSRAFDQWTFELEEGFNICLYGYGSKRPITEAFTAHLYDYLISKPPYKGTKRTPQIVVINGYTPTTTLKEILTTIASTILPHSTKLPNTPPSLLKHLLDHLTTTPPPHPIPIILNSIDSPSLRRTPTPTLLSTLAAHPSISLIATADTPNFPLLWDIGLRTQYRFLYHDTTTFTPYTAELDIVETVNELLSRSGRRVTGRDGVGFVLRSLPENARALFRILVTEQLADAEEMVGVEYRVLYHKAVEEFVCSSEVGFRTLLKEFYDHQMVESRKDAGGTETLVVPFRREELEGLVEDLVGEM